MPAAHALGNERVDKMVAALHPALQERFGDQIKKQPQIVELNSCTDVKFSRHCKIPQISEFVIGTDVKFSRSRHCKIPPNIFDIKSSRHCKVVPNVLFCDRHARRATS